MREKFRIRQLLTGSRDFFQQIPEELRESAVCQFAESSFSRIVISSFIFVLIALIRLTWDIIIDLYHLPGEPLSDLAHIVLLLLITSSMVMFLFASMQQRRPLSVRTHTLLHLTAYLTVDIATLVFCFFEFQQGNFINVQLLFFLFFMAVPLLHLRWNLLNYLFMMIAVCAELLLTPRHALESSIDYLYLPSLLLIFLLFGLYQRSYYLGYLASSMQIRHLNARLSQQSRVDPLTGLENRRAFDEALTAVAEATPPDADALMLMLDLNGLKYTNDTFGHNAGDLLLTAAAGVIRTAYSACGTCFRIGGDEFAVVFPTLPEQPDQIHRKLSAAIAAYNRTTNSTLSIACGVGHLRAPDGSRRIISDWKQDADLAMYRNKVQQKIIFQEASAAAPQSEASDHDPA